MLSPLCSSPLSAPPHPTNPCPVLTFLPPPKHRFTLELEFVQSLSNPHYLHHLSASQPSLLSDPSFQRYCAYLRAYWPTDPYIRYLSHPDLSLRALDLLAVPAFRRDVLNPGVVGRLVEEGMRGPSGAGRG